MLGKSIASEALSPLTCIVELGKSKVMKHIWAASAVSALCTSREALQRSINALCACLDTYNLEVWSILREWDTCTASVKELEEVLAVEESMDKEAEMVQEKARYEAKRDLMVRQKVAEEENEDGGKGKGKSKLEEEEDKPVCHFGLSVKAQGKRPAK